MKKKKPVKQKQPWPTKAAMQQIYELNLWGTSGEDFYSGEGSHATEIVKPYVEAVKDFLLSFKKPLTVCDLGCGDFNVGKQLIPFTQEYIAVDIVPELIERNQQQFSTEKTTFDCIDIANDELPKGDCALLRQVLQHLSNAEIVQIVEKLYAYRFVLLTEHLPQGTFVPNTDIISGQGIRLKKNSGINLQAAPFHFNVKKATTLLSVSPKNGKGHIVTTLFEI